MVGDQAPRVPSKPPQRNRVHNQPKRKDDGKNQMEVLMGQLSRGILECLVCCENIKQAHPVWSCGVCHHVLHLRCVIKWARTSRIAEGWRCPACQHVSDVTPSIYYCFCGKTADPTFVPGMLLLRVREAFCPRRRPHSGPIEL